jgi:hypothetical protein
MMQAAPSHPPAAAAHSRRGLETFFIVAHRFAHAGVPIRKYQGCARGQDTNASRDPRRGRGSGTSRCYTPAVPPATLARSTNSCGNNNKKRDDS